MSTKPEEDPLAVQIRAVEAWCKAKGIVVLPAWSPDHAHVPEVVMSVDDPDRMDKFLVCLEQLGVKLVAMDASRLEAADVEARLRAFDVADDTEAERLAAAEVRACTNRVGQIAMVTLVALTSAPAAVLRCELWAPWHEIIFPDDDADGEDAAEKAEEAVDDGDWGERHRALGRRVAEDPRMIGASNFREREWVAREVLGAEADSDRVSIYKVTQEAAVIMRLQVMPRLQEKAQELRDGGAKPGDIAKALGISLKLAKSLLR